MGVGTLSPFGLPSTDTYDTYWATRNDARPTRWNRQLSKAFDVSQEQYPAESAEEALVSKYLDVEIKHLERRRHAVMSVRMGAFLTAVDKTLAKWVIDDLRNLTWQGKETTPLYDTIQLNSTLKSDFLVDGMRFIRQPGEREVRATIRVQPTWFGLQVTTYGLRSAGTAHHLLHEIQNAAKEINFLKGEAFSLSGEFLPKSGESFDDLFLDQTNASAIKRTIQLINEKQKGLENRGIILMGPPGTGKTLSARIVRNQANATFIWVSSRDFYYSGSFGGFTEAFDLARECAPSVVVFEDIDNWLSERTIDLIKTEMDGIGKSSGVVTMMTTNYPELLPKALIDRPGRFHDVLKFDLPDANARTLMLKRWLPDLGDDDLQAAVNETASYSGAHMRELARFAMIIAEQDQLSLSAALSAALKKLAEQRDLITTAQRSQSHYRTPPEMIAKLGARVVPVPDLVTKDFVGEGRAYAMFHVKDMNEEQRTIEGIATHPEPDRVGDIIEPLGVSFRSDIKLLLYHDKTKPVGHVQFQPPTKDGVRFKAVIPKIAEAGVLKERVEEAWQSIKYKLLTGVSIGFRVVDGAVERIKDGGYRFLKTELVELSLVSVPAQQNATITLIKSIDAGRSAAFGTPTRSTSLSGVADAPPITARKDAGPMLKTLAEQRTAYEATRAANAAQMLELMNKSGAEGRTLDEAEQQEYDRLDSEVASIDKHLTRLTSLEQLQIGTLRPVAGGGTKSAELARIPSPQVTVVGDRLPPGIEFARYAMCLASAKGNVGQALEIAKNRYPDQLRIQTVLKAAVAAGTTTDPTWAGALVDYQNFAGDFIEFLRPATIIGKFGNGGVPSLRRVPFNISVPGQTTGGDAWWVGEGKPKPVTKFDFTPTTLRWAKVANIAVITEELARFSSPSAETLVRDALAQAIIARIDTDFVDPTKAAVADVSPASITNGITAIPSSGTEAIDVRTDIAALFAPFITNNLTPANGVFIMNASMALALSLMVNTLGQQEFPGITMNGGTFVGLPVIVSQYVPAGIVILANASDIYLADDGQVVIDVSREASLQMLDNPTNATADTASPPAPIATSMVSLWQTNSIGLRAERFINWQRRRDEAVQYLEDVAWAAGSPA